MQGAAAPGMAAKHIVPGARSFERSRWVVPAIIALALSVRLPGLLRQSLWIDEFITTSAVPMSWEGMYHRLLLGGETHPLLYSTLLKLWALLFGYSKLSLRLFSVGAGALFVHYSHRLAARLLSPRVALVTALLAAASPYALYYSQEVRSYMLFGLLTTASYCYFFDYIETRAKSAYVLWLLAQAAALETHTYGAFVLAAQGLYILHHLWRRRDRALFIDQLGGCVIIGLTFSPWIAVILLSKAEYLAREPFGPQEPIGVGHVAYVLYALFFGYSLGPSVEDLHRLHGIKAVVLSYGAVTSLAIFSLLPLLVLGVRRIGAMPGARIVIALGVAVPLAATFAVSLVCSLPFNVRYLIPTLPFFLMTVAAGLCALAERGARGAVAAAPFALAVGISLFNYHTNPRYWREDYERTAAHIHAQPGIRVLAGASPDTLRLLVPDMDVTRLSRDDLAAVKPGEKRWLVWNRTWGFDKTNSLHEEVVAQFRFLSEQRYPGFEIELAEKR